MFSHVTIGSLHLDRATSFYDSVLAPLGLERRPSDPDGGPPMSCWVVPGQAMPKFFVSRPFDGQPASVGNGSMLAFAAPSRIAVDAAHEAALAHGGTDEGAPGERPHYGAGYYGAYLRDLDGNKIHVVFRGDVIAS